MLKSAILKRDKFIEKVGLEKSFDKFIEKENKKDFEKIVLKNSKNKSKIYDLEI